MKVLYFDCFSGASGDMILGALIDAGADPEDVLGCLESLDLQGWQVSFDAVTKDGVAGTKATVSVTDEAQARSYTDLVSIVEAAELPDPVKRRSLQILRTLGEAESKVHGAPLNEIHLHEAGGHDALIDIVGSAAAIETIGPASIVTSPVATGRGQTTSAHGILPVPGPAVLELLRGAPIQEQGSLELITPTGAAILVAMSDRFGTMPAMNVTTIGYGAGDRDGVDLPNVLRVVVGETDDAGQVDRLVLETNIDDMNPELIPYAIERLLEAGAEDAWTSPITMKKGRSAVTLSTLSTRGALDDVLKVLYRETTTFGVRMRGVTKDELDRRWVTVTVSDLEVRVKIGVHEGEEVNASVEYEDAAEVARKTGLPLKEIYRQAIQKATGE